MKRASSDKSPATSRTLVSSDTPEFLAFAGLLIAAVTALAAGLIATRAWEGCSVASIGVWLIFVAVANMLPVPAGRNIYLSMGSPINIAVAFSFPPPLAAVIVFAGAFSEWELRRQTTFLHALFNRAQIAVAAALASFVLTNWRGATPPFLAMVAAVVAYQGSNLLFVSVAEQTSRGAALGSVLKKLIPPGIGAATAYLALGLMGFVFGLAYMRIGAWSVALLLIPLISARQALKVSRDLEKAERDRRVLADRLIDERERERVRIASDIHDTVLQQMAALELQADNIASSIEAGQAGQAASIAAQSKTGIRQAIAGLRGAIRNLRRVALDEDGLLPTVERFARSFHAETGIEVNVRSDGVTSADIPLPVGLLLYECAQEALTNVARHSGATAVELTFAGEGEALQMTVRDNGNGIAEPGAGGPADSSGGLGLGLTRDKVALSGGGFWVESKRGEGTEVRVRVPVIKTQ
jgi:signal transduction histidine kinase